MSSLPDDLIFTGANEALTSERPADRILLVDSDAALLKTLRQGLNSLLPEAEVLVASDAHSAISTLEEHPIQLVVMDLMLPTGRGFELLSHLDRRDDGMSVFVMGKGLTPDVRQRAANLGGIWCFDKPVPLRRLADAAKAVFSASPRSIIHGVTVAGLLQLLETERKTCTLTVRNHLDCGRLFLSRGRLVDAEWRLLRGVEAAQSLVRLEDASVEIDDVLASDERTIDTSLARLLLDTCQLADEGACAERAPAGRADVDSTVYDEGLASLNGLGGFVAAAVYRWECGILARSGDPDVVDRELCRVGDGAIRWFDSHLAEHRLGSVIESDHMTADGWLIAWRAIPGDDSSALVAAFHNPTNIGLLQLRLREFTSGLVPRD